MSDPIQAEAKQAVDNARLRQDKRAAIQDNYRRRHGVPTQEARSEQYEIELEKRAPEFEERMKMVRRAKEEKLALRGMLDLTPEQAKALKLPEWSKDSGEPKAPSR